MNPEQTIPRCAAKWAGREGCGKKLATHPDDVDITALPVLEDG